MTGEQDERCYINGKFLGHIFADEMDLALAIVGDDARFVASRPESSAENPIFGTHIGPERAQAFFTAFGVVIEPGEFKISDTSGKPFVSDWALIARFAQGRLVDYHINEDTAALADAMRAS